MTQLFFGRVARTLLGLAAVLTLAGSGGAGVAQAARILPGVSRLSITAGTQSATVERGKSYIFSYKVYNSGLDTAQVTFNVDSDANWAVALSADGALIAPKSAVEVKVQVTVPGTTMVRKSLLKVGAFAPRGSAVTYTKLTVGPSVSGP